MQQMQKALELAKEAAGAGDVPVGAVMVRGGQVIAQAYNRIEADNDPTAHAELLVIREAGRLLGTRYLTDCELIVTLEPCPMCAQAISFARIGKLTYGAYDPKGGGVEHGPRIFQQPSCHHAPDVVGGLMEAECSALLKKFFMQKRMNHE
jgi:tRNA(adenine34) deaminase